MNSFLFLREVELNHIPYPSPTAARTCINNDALTVLATTLPNLEHGLEINTPGFDTPVSLSNTLFLEEDQRSLSTPTNLEEGHNSSVE